MSDYQRLWTVSSGQYSDYRAHAVFATKKAAEKALRQWKGLGDGWSARNGFVEEMTFYPEGIEPEPVTTYSRQIDLWDDGRMGDNRSTESHDQTRTEIEFDTLHGIPSPRPKVRFVRAPIHQNKGGRLEVSGSDEAAVDKTYTDLVAQWKAQGHHLNVRG